MQQYRYHPLTEAARNNDAIAEEQGFEKAIQHLGLNVEAVMHIARQRAMRLVILVMRGPIVLKELNTGRPEVVRLSDDEEAMVQTLTLGLLDGIVIGWRGREIDIDNDREAEGDNR